MADQVRVENLKGESEVVKVEEMRKMPLSDVKAKASATSLKYAYPIFVGDLMMVLDLRGTFS